MPTLHALIVAAGASRRMGFDKLAAPLGGRPVLWHSVSALAGCEEVCSITLVTRPETSETFHALALDAARGKALRIVSGGAERHLSVWAGLESLPLEAGFVAVHDAARPLITPEAVSECFSLARACGAAACASPVTDTLKRADSSGKIINSLDRSGLWAMQTPQIFDLKLLRRAYRAVLDAGDLVTDEVSALQMIGAPVALFDNPDWNFKITFPADVDLAALVLSHRAQAGAGHSPRSRLSS